MANFSGRFTSLGMRAGAEMDKLLKASYREGVDSREQPLYTIAEASQFLGVNSQTLTTWLFGRTYPVKGRTEFWPRVITPADEELRLLSFYNLAEAHVLASTRYEHKVPFWAVRQAITSLVEKYPDSAEHPLLADDFLTNGRFLFTQKINEVVNHSSQQLPLEIITAFLHRVLNDGDGKTYKFYPLRSGEANDRIISIAAGVSASRPIIDSAGIPVMTVWRRFDAGEKPEYIADDFEIDVSEVRRAIAYVEKRAA